MERPQPEIDLFDYLNQHGALPEKVAKKIFRQVRNYINLSFSVTFRNTLRLYFNPCRNPSKNNWLSVLTSRISQLL